MSNILFYPSSGEIDALCTKETRKYHESEFSGGSSSCYLSSRSGFSSSSKAKYIGGRKTDLLFLAENRLSLLCVSLNLEIIKVSSRSNKEKIFA
jgi:hypothetical protein